MRIETISASAAAVYLNQESTPEERAAALQRLQDALWLMHLQAVAAGEGIEREYRCGVSSERMQEISQAYVYCIDHDRWPDGFNPFDAIRDLLAEARGSLHHVVSHPGGSGFGTATSNREDGRNDR